MAVYDVPTKAECRAATPPVNRYDKRRFNVAYRVGICRFNGRYLLFDTAHGDTGNYEARHK